MLIHGRNITNSGQRRGRRETFPDRIVFRKYALNRFNFPETNAVDPVLITAVLDRLMEIFQKPVHGIRKNIIIITIIT